ncbi:hypothetical protein [Nocardioides sp. GXZ039]|uniref:hypothetical protein n=1 Tax=Nocardioides sp. GXZ039 TaxID=3136018 RepID=UPI0030F4ACC3
MTALSGLLGGMLLAGCGEEPDTAGEYCDLVVDEQPALSGMIVPERGTSGLLGGLPVFERLEAAAPEAVDDDWTIIVGRLSSLADPLQEAGVDPATYDPIDPPTGLSEDQREAIEGGAGSVASEALREALDRVDRHAHEVCGADLGL